MSKSINTSNIDINDLESLYDEDEYFVTGEKQDQAVHMKYSSESRHREQTKEKNSQRKQKVAA